MNFLLLFLIIFTLVNNPIGVLSKCNDDCLTRTYCLSSNGSSFCSKNNLVTATLSSLNQRPDIDSVKLTLSTGNLQSSDSRSISLTFKSTLVSSSLTNYTCSYSPVGTIANVTQQYYAINQVILLGNSSYSNGILTCSWSFSNNDIIWPLLYDNYISLLNDEAISLQLSLNNITSIVAKDVSDLPLNHLKYLQCCNKVHGNGNYLAIFNQTSDNYYLLRLIGVRPDEITLSLNSLTGSQLKFTCKFNSQQIAGFVTIQNETVPITNMIYNQYIAYLQNPNLVDLHCYWSHSRFLSGSFGQLDTTDVTFDMEILADGVVVYTENGVTLKNSASKLLSLTNLVIMVISLILNWSL